MPNLDCPNCGAIRSVRQDRTITGDIVNIDYECLRCGRRWRTKKDQRRGPRDRRRSPRGSDRRKR